MMNRREFVRDMLIALFAMGLPSAFASESGDAAGETRYLANGGDDAADGKTPATAWRSLEKASEALPGGATLRMKCGDVFYGQLRPAAGVDAEHPTVVTSWGEGPKPVISATKNLKGDPSVWEDMTHCFWRINLANPTNSTGIVTDDCNPGFLLVDGELKPWRRFCRSDLVSPWDFCGEGGYLYVHADANPAKLAKDIRVALRIYCVQFGSFTVISNIAVRATGAHGMHAGWGNSVRDVRIADCELENIGGSELPGYERQSGFRIRFGNGIELGGDAENVVIERCSFRGVYDVAFTMQGFPKKGWRDVHCRNCTMTDCTQAFEIWCGKAPKGVGFRNCSFTGNRTLRVGGGWGEKVRPCRAVATPLLIYGLQTDTIDIDVSGNVFEDAPHGLIGGKVSGKGAFGAPIGYRVHDNVLSCAGDNPVKLMIPKADATVVQLDAAEPIWTTAERGEVNSSVAFVSGFDWDGVQPLKLRLAGCSIFKVFVNGEFAAYGPARGPHGWFRMDEWDIARFAKKGRNHLTIEGVAYNTTTYYIVNHAPFLQAEVVAGGKAVRATGDGQWMAVPTSRVRQVPRYSLQRAQSEVYVVDRLWDAARRGVVGWNPVTLAIKKQPPVKLLGRDAPYPTFEMDRTYQPTDVLSVKLRTGDLGKPPHLWDEKTSFLGKTYPSDILQYVPAIEWWKREIESKGQVKARGEGEQWKVNSSCGVRFAGAINDTGFLRLKVKVAKPGRILVGFDEILVGGKLDFLNRFGCNNIVMWDVKEPGEYAFESFEPYTFKYAEVIMLEGEATVERLEMRNYKNPNATRACTLTDPADRKIFEAARETFAQNAVDVFTDCPSRERAGWLCDSYFTGPAEHFFTGRNEIERTFLRNFALAEKFPHLPEGMVPMCYPGDHINGNYIPNWSMWFVLEVANYFERTGDRETVDLLRPRVEGLLKFYAKYLNVDGLLENLPGWVFVEWSHANETKLVKDGVNWPSNMTYAEVLAKAAKLYGRPELAAQAEKLRKTLREMSFDGTWFRDNAKHPDVTETCQYYAFFHGIATPKTHPELWKRLTDEFGPERQKKGLYKEVWPSNAFIGNLMRLIVLKREGRDEQVAREIRGYYLKMAEATGTLWEHDRPEASCNHGFASYLAILLDDPERTATATCSTSGCARSI